MNILALTAYAPVLRRHGGAVLMYHQIKILASRHSVRVISFIESEEEREMLRPLEEFCESVIAIRRIPDYRSHWLSLDPFLAREFSAPEMYQAVESEFRKKRVDVLLCEYLQMAQFNHPPVFTVLTLPEILSANAYDAFLQATEPKSKLTLFYRWMQMLRFETSMSRRADCVIMMTEHDAEYLRSYLPDQDIRAIPIGIDPDEFTPLPEDAGEHLEMVFVGNFRHTPNVQAAEFLIDEIAPRFPAIQVTIAGSYVPDTLPARAPANVAFPGYIPDIRTLYRRPNTVAIAPLFSGTGQRVKLLEAFSMACPVVTTTVGAFGFPLRNTIDGFVADTAEEFAAALRELFSSEDLRRRVGQNAREMIIRGFTWAQIGEELLQIVSRR